MKLDANLLMFVALRFGKSMRLDDLAKMGKWGKTKERVRQYEAKVLREVKKNDPAGLYAFTGLVGNTTTLTGRMG